MFSKQELLDAARIVHASMGPTAQIEWPLLSERCGARVIVKHENHLPTGAFKARGAVTFMAWLKQQHPNVSGIITATRGNHGQAQALAASKAGLRSIIYVPQGNSKEKNAAMKAFGAELRIFGADYDEAREAALQAAEVENLYFVPPFHKELVRGVATYGLELFTAHPDLDTVFVPVGCGSGLCATIAARDALGLKTQIVGVVPQNASCVKDSFDAGHPIAGGPTNTFADGTAVRVPVPAAFDIYSRGAERIVCVSEDAIADAVRALYSDTHNLAEGSGAIGLAALVSEGDRHHGQKVGLILSGGNIDADKFSCILRGETPRP